MPSAGRTRGGPEVKVFSGAVGKVLSDFYAYSPAFRGGVRVAAGDVNGDGKADVITGAGPSGGPHVEVFSGADGSVLLSLYAYAPGFAGGVRVAAAAGRDGRADIVTAPGMSGGPDVRVFDGAGAALLDEYYAYDPTFQGGVFVGGSG